MDRFDYCTFVLLGYPPERKGVLDDDIKALCTAVTNREISVFNIAEAKSKLIEGNSPQSKTLKSVIASGHHLQDSFYSIMIETFLHEKKFVGPVVFADFPKKLEHARSLKTALNFFGRDLVIVLNFDSGKTKATNEIALYFKENSNYIYLDIQDEEQLKAPHDDLARKFAELI